MINRIVLVGRLTRDPELRKTNSEISVCSFTVAVDNPVRNADGTRSASFIPCVVYKNTADNMTKFLRKGALVGIDGRLNQRSFNRQDGTRASILEIVCDSVQFLEPKKLNSGNDELVSFESDIKPGSNDDKNLDSLDLPDDDLPF